MSRFEVISAPMDGLKLLGRARLGDSRGYLSRLFDAKDLKDLGWPGGIAQINETLTEAKGTLRGMHFQFPPHADAKLVTCLEGSVLDVVVDIRKSSPTFLTHFSAELSAENARSLLVPEGFAHGFQTLSDNVRMIYAHSASYCAEAEGGLSPFDPRLDIDWPLPVAALSARDRGHKPIDQEFSGVSL